MHHDQRTDTNDWGSITQALIAPDETGLPVVAQVDEDGEVVVEVGYTMGPNVQLIRLDEGAQEA
jgi:hypothetical protein